MWFQADSPDLRPDLYSHPNRAFLFPYPNPDLQYSRRRLPSAGPVAQCPDHPFLRNRVFPALLNLLWMYRVQTAPCCPLLLFRYYPVPALSSQNCGGIGLRHRILIRGQRLDRHGLLLLHHSRVQIFIDLLRRFRYNLRKFYQECTGQCIAPKHSYRNRNGLMLCCKGLGIRNQTHGYRYRFIGVQLHGFLLSIHRERRTSDTHFYRKIILIIYRGHMPGEITLHIHTAF